MSLTTTTAIAVIFLALHAAVMLLVLLALGFVLARTMVLVNRKTRDVMPTVQQYARQMADGAEKMSERVTAPVVEAHASATRWQASWRRATEPLRPRTTGTGGSAPTPSTPSTSSRSQEG